MLDSGLKKELQIFATQIRIAMMEEFLARGFGHLGGSLSIADLLSVLYGKVMKIDPQNPGWEGRDYLVLSKGHAGPALYATLALRGYFDREVLKTLNQPGTNLPSHPDRNKTIGIDMSTGSLGQGISQAAGAALGFKLQGKTNKVYAIVGDGECNEGQVWEATLFARQRKLDNLIVFIDNNGKQLDGYTRDICDMGDFCSKFESFGWHAQSVDGNDVEQVYDAIDKASLIKDKPSVIVLNTVKGKGVKFVEDTVLNHHIYISREQAIDAINGLKAELAGLIS
ncbi:MAG: transketolase [Acetivibrionales bacterium]